MSPLPSTGSISLGQIGQEFGSGPGGIKIGQYRTAYSVDGIYSLPFDTGIPTGDVSISFNQFRGKQLNTVQIIAGPRAGIGKTIIRETISPSKQVAVGELLSVNSTVRSRAKNIVYVYNIDIGSSKDSEDRRTICALRTNTTSSWYGSNNFSSNGASIILNINSSTISGAGGNGGKGGDENEAGDAGENGTSALGLQVPVTTINLNSSKLLAGGGGGGGGGGSRETSRNERRAGGGGGGGGQGIPAGGGGGIRKRGEQSEGEEGQDGKKTRGGNGGGGSNNNEEARGGSGGGGGGVNPGEAGSGNGGESGKDGSEEGGGKGGDGNATGEENMGETVGGQGGSNGFSIVSNSGIAIPSINNNGSTFFGDTSAGGRVR